ERRDRLHPRRVRRSGARRRARGGSAAPYRCRRREQHSRRRAPRQAVPRCRGQGVARAAPGRQRPRARAASDDGPRRGRRDPGRRCGGLRRCGRHRHPPPHPGGQAGDGQRRAARDHGSGVPRHRRQAGL
ncbi:MAG: UspA domain protein, partial [uncultured Nocardioides sp.]